MRGTRRYYSTHTRDYGKEPRFKSAEPLQDFDSFAACQNVPAIKIGCVARSQALDSMHESVRWSTWSLRRLLCLCALGSCSSGFLFWQRLLCAFILSVVRRLLRLLSKLLRLWVGRLLPALVAASVLRRVLRRVAQARVGRRTRLAWRRMARPSLTWSLGQDTRLLRHSTHVARLRGGEGQSVVGVPFSALSLWRTPIV
jgi:hypothetical protein